VVVRKWMTKHQILNAYGDKLSREDVKKMNDSWRDSFSEGTYYVRSYTSSRGMPMTEGLKAGQEIVPGYPTG